MAAVVGTISRPLGFDRIWAMAGPPNRRCSLDGGPETCGVGNAAAGCGSLFSPVAPTPAFASTGSGQGQNRRGRRTKADQALNRLGYRLAIAGLCLLHLATTSVTLLFF